MTNSLLFVVRNKNLRYCHYFIKFLLKVLGNWNGDLVDHQRPQLLTQFHQQFLPTCFQNLPCFIKNKKDKPRKRENIWLVEYPPNESENDDKKKSGGKQNLGPLILLTSKIDKIMIRTS